MKPYVNLSGKAKWWVYWGDKIPRKFRRIFKKSARQLNKKCHEQN